MSEMIFTPATGGPWCSACKKAIPRDDADHMVLIPAGFKDPAPHLKLDGFYDVHGAGEPRGACLIAGSALHRLLGEVGTTTQRDQVVIACSERCAKTLAGTM